MDETRAAPSSPTLGPGPLVLVLEDVGMIAFALADLLEGAGYRVLGPFARTIDALTGLADSAPDLAVIDHGAGEADRGAVVAALRAARVPFLVHSGVHRPVGDAAFEGVPWLVKPAPSARVLEELAQLAGGLSGDDNRGSVPGPRPAP